MKDTLIVNLFGGPGCGKSTGAAYIFSRLKLGGIDAEYISEYAKDKVWESNNTALGCQLFISGKQAYRLHRTFGKVDVIITDSPLLLGTQYITDGNPDLGKAIIYEHRKYDPHNVNILLTRVKPYNPNGRLQTESESRNIDGNIRALLEENSIPYTEVPGDSTGYEYVLSYIEAIMDAKQNIN